MDSLTDLAKKILSGAKTNILDDLDLMSNPKRKKEYSQKNMEMAMQLVTAGMTSSPTRLVTGPHPVYKGISSMVPHVVDVYDSAGNFVKTTPVYSSFQKALDIAKNYLDIPVGGRAFPRAVR
jgi:hypothetical protein